MSDTIEALISKVIEREGGYVNHPQDRGGPTNWGITQATLADWRGQPVTEFQVKTLSEGEAREIYRDRYVTKPGFDAIPDAGVKAFLIDYGVNSGPGTAVKALQSVLSVQADGVIGPQSKAALAKVTNWPALYNALIAQRSQFFLGIVGRDHSQAVFALGWRNRIAEFKPRIA